LPIFGEKWSKSSKIVKNRQKSSKIVKNRQKSSKIVKNRQNRQKSSKIVKNRQKSSKIVKIAKNRDQNDIQKIFAFVRLHQMELSFLQNGNLFGQSFRGLSG
jgi:hypothetical protein